MSELTKEETAQLVEDWCQDLEKNADKQGKGLLHAVAEDGEETFCCLGRLCVVAKEKYGDRLGIKSVYVDGDIIKYGAGDYGDIDGEIIHESLRDKIGLRTRSGDIIFPPEEDEDFNEPYEVALTEINDDWGKTFPEIAQLIREHKGELFPILGETSENKRYDSRSTLLNDCMDIELHSHEWWDNYGAG